jgi:hypothetical protein
MQERGLIPDVSTGIPEEARNENVFAMFRAGGDFRRHA